VSWRCADCDRRHDDDPGTCVCGSVNLEPTDRSASGSRFSLLAVRRRLLAPGDADRSLVRNEPYVSLAVRVVLAVGILVALFVAVRVLL
jgi:hypothetical protein